MEINEFPMEIQWFPNGIQWIPNGIQWCRKPLFLKVSGSVAKTFVFKSFLLPFP